MKKDYVGNYEEIIIKRMSYIESYKVYKIPWQKERKGQKGAKKKNVRVEMN